MDSGEKLVLADLFKEGSAYYERLSQLSRQALARKLKNKELIQAGTEPSPENFKNWNLKPRGLALTFDKSHVAPYVYGAQTILIPYRALEDILDPDSVISECLAHPARCKRSKILTGGFIDEAINTHHRRLNPILSLR